MSLQNTPDTWFWIGLILLILVSIYSEIQMDRSQNRGFRILAILLALSSLAAIYLVPTIVQVAPKIQLVWKTTGADPRTADSLVALGYDEIQTIQELEQREESVEKIVLLGEGLPESTLERINAPIAFVPGRLSEGIVEITHSPAVAESEFTLNGRVAIWDSLDLMVDGLGHTTRVRLTPEEPRFHISLIPKVAGSFLYSLTGIRGNDTLFLEQYPVTVASVRNPSILMLSGVPSFELRYLKNHLTDKGYRLAYQYDISPDIRSQEFHNLDQRNLSTLNEALLSDFDVLIISGDRYASLSDREQTEILRAIREGKLGLLFTDPLPNRSLLGTVRQTPEDKTQFDTESGEIFLKHRRLEFDGIEIEWNEKPIGRVRSMDLGSVGYCRFPETYTLLLKGQSDLYGKIWQRMFNELMGTKPTEEFIEVTLPIYVDEPTTLQFISASELPELRIENDVVPIRERFDRSGFYSAPYWPKGAGWHSALVLPDSLVTHFYTAPKASWKTMRSYLYQEQTTTYLSRTGKTQYTERTIDTPVSRWYFFLLFLLSAGYLWLEQKLNG